MSRRPSATVSLLHPLALVPAALTAWVYHGITRVYFLADDFYHLGHIANGETLPWLIAPFGGHNFLVRNLAFLASWRLFGLHSEGWFWTVLCTHLLNVWLLFGVLGALTGSAALAAFGAALWGMTPIALGTIGWYAVFGQAMAATVLLLVLLQACRLRNTGAPLPAATAGLWYVLLLAGTTCFGVGVGVALVFPVVLFLLLPGAWRQPRVRLAYLALPVVTVVVYVAFLQLWARIAPDGLFPNPPLGEVRETLAMLLPMFAFAIAGTLLGHAFLAQQFPDATTWAAVAAFGFGVGLLWRGGPDVRRAALAMAALAAAVYGMIAVGRAHAYAGAGISLVRAAAEPRYHYVGMIPVVILVGLVLAELGRMGPLAAVPRGVLLTIGLGLAVAAYGRSRFRIGEHGAARAHVERTKAEIAAAVAGSPPGATVYIENGPTSPVLGPLLELVLPGRAGVFLLLSPDDTFAGRRVRFVEDDADARARFGARAGTRLATLLVAPPPAGEASVVRPPAGP